MPPKKVERTPLMEPFETGATEALYADQKIGDEDALKVAEALKTNTTVTLLDLTGCELTDTSGVAIAEALKTNTTISKLKLDNNGVGDPTIIALSEILATSTVMEELWFQVCKITNAGAEVLKVALEKSDAAELPLHTCYVGCNFGIVGENSFELTSSIMRYPPQQKDIKSDFDELLPLLGIDIEKRNAEFEAKQAEEAAKSKEIATQTDDLAAVAG